MIDQDEDIDLQVSTTIPEQRRYCCRSPQCTYQADKKWTGPCKGCGGWYDCILNRKAKTEMQSRTSLAAAINQLPERDFRISTGIVEVNRVLSGGLVPGSTIIISGPPGTGKTSLLLPIADHVAKGNRKVIYASGEESVVDLGKTAKRLGISNEQIEVLGMEGNIDTILDAVEEKKAKFLIIDSLQKAFLNDSNAEIGSVSQGKLVIETVFYFCKKKNISAVIISQVNKSGGIAGSLGIEHDVDTLLEFFPVTDEEEEYCGVEESDFRKLVVGKNRRGASGLSELFRLTPQGIIPVRKKSKLYPGS